MATYDYDTLGEKFVAAHTKTTVYRVFEKGNHAVTVCECFDFDNLVKVVNALNAAPSAPLFSQEDWGDVVA